LFWYDAIIHPICVVLIWRHYTSYMCCCDMTPLYILYVLLWYDVTIHPTCVVVTWRHYTSYICCCDMMELYVVTILNYTSDVALLVWCVMPYLHGCLTCTICNALLAWCIVLCLHNIQCFTRMICNASRAWVCTERIISAILSWVTETNQRATCLHSFQSPNSNL
jgi:hypothetical protein